MLERRLSERQTQVEGQQRRLFVAVGTGFAAVLVGALITVGLIVENASRPAPYVTPPAVQAFASSLPQSQHPDTSGVKVIDGSAAPNTWRVAWETADAAFCFAFVHESGPNQTGCDAPGSAETAKMRLVGELDDTGVTQPAPFVCGYTTGMNIGVDYAEIGDGEVVGYPVEVSSGLDGFCLQVPDDITTGESFTVSTYVVTGGTSQHPDTQDVTATYP